MENNTTPTQSSSSQKATSFADIRKQAHDQPSYANIDLLIEATSINAIIKFSKKIPGLVTSHLDDLKSGEEKLD